MLTRSSQRIFNPKRYTCDNISSNDDVIDETNEETSLIANHIIVNRDIDRDNVADGE